MTERRRTPGQERNRSNPYQPHCPVCGEMMVHTTIGRDNWAYCDVCQVAADVGSGFGSWREHDNDLDRERNARHFAGYRVLSDDDMYGPDVASLEGTP